MNFSVIPVSISTEKGEVAGIQSTREWTKGEGVAIRRGWRDFLRLRFSR